MNKSVVIVPLGRFSPPHKEHESLVNSVLKLAKSTHSDAKIFVSRTVDKKKNPLTPQEKIKYLNKMFPGHKGLFDMPPANNPTMIGALAALSGKYETVHIVLGDDRVAATETLVNKYNGKDFTFDKIIVHSRHSIISTRVGDADGVHASDIRDWARAGDFDKVRESMSKHLSDADVKEIMHLIQSRLGSTVKESALDDLFMEYIIESDEPTITFPSDSEMSKQIDDMSDDELDLDDSDVLMLDVIVGQDIEKEDVSEAKVLSIQTRQKLAQRMKGMSKRLARLRQIKAKTMPAQQRLRMRARKAAIMMLRKRATGKKNLDYNSLSKSQRIAVDNALVQRFGKSLNSAVDKLSKRIMPMIRKKAQTNVAKARDVKESFIYEDKGKEGTKADVKSDIKQAKKRGISVSDWEKSKADKAHDSPLNIDPTKLDNLSIDPTKNDRTAPNPEQGHLHQNRKLMHYARSVDEGRKSSADKDARDAGDTNIIYQMRKTINSRGEHETTFADGHKAHISVNDAKKMLAKFEALRMPADKHSFTIAAGKSLQAFRNVMAHGIPKDKPKISLGGRQFNEFYLGVGRSRTVSPYDKDEPPGVRNVGEVAKDEDRPEDPNRSRPLSQKLDLLLRLGLSDQEELQKYRRALRSSKKHALQSPQMREALANLLDKLIDLTTKDPATYSRVRYNVMNKEANSLLRKAEESGVPVEIIYEVFARGYEMNNSVNEAFNRVNSFIAGGKAADLDSDLIEDVTDLAKRYKDFVTGGGTPQTASRYKSHVNMLAKKTGQHPIQINKQVRKHVKSMKEVTEPTGGLKDACWSGYTAVGMKMKNGRKVPNCVPKEETQIDELSKETLKSYVKKVDKRGEGVKRGTGLNTASQKIAKQEPTSTLKKTVDSIKNTPHGKLKSSSVYKFGASHAELRKRGVKEETTTEAKNNWARTSKENERSSAAYLNFNKKKSYVDRKVTPMKADDAKNAADAMKTFMAKGGTIQKIEPGKKTIKSFVKPKKYMTPNQASRVTEGTEGAKGTNGFKKLADYYKKNKSIVKADEQHNPPIPLSQRVKRVKPFHAKHPPVTNHEAYTGSEPVSKDKNNPANRFVGTDTIVQNYIDATPGQKKPINEAFSAGFELAPFARDYGMTVQAGFEHHPDVQEQLDAIEEATYKGKTVPLNKPMKGDVKKSKVYVDPDGDGIAKKVNFGDKKLSIKKDQPARKRSYCARSSGQGNLNNKSSANYWSRRAWDC